MNFLQCRKNNVDMESKMDGIKLTLNTRIVSGKYSLNEIVNDKGYKKIGVKANYT